MYAHSTIPHLAERDDDVYRPRYNRGMDEWEALSGPGSSVSYSTVIVCNFGQEPDPAMTAIEMAGSVSLSALVIWLVVRLINHRRSLRRLPPAPL